MINTKLLELDILLANAQTYISYNSINQISSKQQLEQIVELYKTYLKPELSFTDCCDQIKRMINVDNVFITANNNNDSIIGFISAEHIKGLLYFNKEDSNDTNTIYLSDIVVDKNYKGQNISSQLFKRLIKECKSNNIKYIVLYALNNNAKSIYLHWGFNIIDIPKDNELYNWNNNYLGLEL